MTSKVMLEVLSGVVCIHAAVFLAVLIGWLNGPFIGALDVGAIVLAIVAVALLKGVVTAVACAAGIWAGIAYFVLPPLRSFGIAEPFDLSLLTTTVLLACALGAALRNMLSRARD